MLNGITTIILSWPFIHGSQPQTNKQPGTSWTNTLRELSQPQQACRLLLVVHKEGAAASEPIIPTLPGAAVLKG